MESSMFHLGCHRNPTPFSYVAREWSPHVFHLLETIHAAQYRKECEKNLAGERKNDVHNEVGFCQCRFQHREGNKPIEI